MKKLTPLMFGYMIGHYFIAIVLSFVFLVVGLYLLPVKAMGPIGFGAIGGGFLILAILLLYAFLYTKTTAITFDGDKVVFETGILSKRTKKVPVHMITDSSLNRSFLQRILGAATLNISTSGSTGYEIVCEGLRNQQARELHDEIYERINQLQRQ
jgi:uncharacterized membrane protein YdbT with pleckstrin-like domain